MSWFYRNIGYRFKYAYNSTKNLIRWFPIIYNDRDWDSWYIFTIIQTKLKFQSKYIGERDLHTRAKRDAEVMNLCVNLIEKVKEEYYVMEYMDYHHTEYKFIDSDTPGYKQMVFDDISEWFEGYFKKYPLIYTKVLNSENNLFPIVNKDTNRVSNKMIAMNISYINHSRARKLLFKIMNERIEGWWD